MPTASLRSIFFCAESGVASVVAARSAIRMRGFKSASPRHFGSAAKQVHFLPVARGKHLDQHLVRRIAGERVPRLEDSLVDGAEARLQLSNRLRREHSLLAVEQLLQDARGAK